MMISYVIHDNKKKFFSGTMEEMLLAWHYNATRDDLFEKLYCYKKPKDFKWKIKKWSGALRFSATLLQSGT